MAGDGDAVQAVLLQLAYELRDDVREVRDDVREVRKRADDVADVLSDLSRRVAVLEATRSHGPASQHSAKRDVGLMAGASGLVAVVVELLRQLS